MSENTESFPSRTQLWRGAVLGTIAHAIWVMADPLLSAAQSWAGPNYSLNDSSGARGTITFAPRALVGAFFDERSPRSPYRSGGAGSYRPDTYFAGAPDEVWAIASGSTLRYLLDAFQAETTPVLTAAFWGVGDSLTSVDPWPLVVEHGAHLLRRIVMPASEAIRAWGENYEFSDEQEGLLQSLYNRRMADVGAAIVLEREEWHILVSGGDDGLVDATQLFAAVGIVVRESD